MDVALPDHLEVADHVGGGGAEHVVLPVGQSLAWSHHDALPGVDAQGVQVLHVAHGDAVVVGVPHHLVLHLLPALQALVNDQLAGVGKGLSGQCAHLSWVFCKPRTLKWEVCN